MKHLSELGHSRSCQVGQTLHTPVRVASAASATRRPPGEWGRGMHYSITVRCVMHLSCFALEGAVKDWSAGIAPAGPHTGAGRMTALRAGPEAPTLHGPCPQPALG
jgi:hypothetical protein